MLKHCYSQEESHDFNSRYTIYPNITMGSNSITSLTSSSQDRMQYHKAILESVGITALSSLGTLNLSGNLIPQAGLTRLDPNLAASQVYFQSAYKLTNTVAIPVLQPAGGQATILKAIPSLKGLGKRVILVKLFQSIMKYGRF